MVKICAKCKAENSDNADFCQVCGRRLKVRKGAMKKGSQDGGILDWWNKQNDKSKFLILIVGIFVVLGLILVITITTANTSNTTQTSTSQQTWHSVANFSGSGDKTTAPFSIKGSKFKVKYNITRTQTDFGYFTLYVYLEGQTKSYVDSFELEDKSQLSENDESFIYDGPGDYYLKILASNMKEWNVEVFDYY